MILGTALLILISACPSPAPAAGTPQSPAPSQPITVNNNGATVNINTTGAHHKKHHHHRHHHHRKHHSVATVYYHVSPVYRTIATYRHVEFMPHHVVAHPPTPTPAHTSPPHKK
jgi:hypothetical protein